MEKSYMFEPPRTLLPGKNSLFVTSTETAMITKSEINALSTFGTSIVTVLSALKVCLDRGDLREKIMKVKESGDPTSRLRAIERLIGEMKTYRFDSSPLMLELHHLARRCHLAKKNAGKALQIS